MNIVFVCTGNTCRSPMAEGFFKSFTERDKKISVYSKGISAQVGESASVNSVIAASQFGVDITNHKSGQLTIHDVENADYLFTMTNQQAYVLKKALPDFSDKIFCVSEYVDCTEISDPYGGNLGVYNECACQIYDCVKKIYGKLTDADDGNNI